MTGNLLDDSDWEEDETYCVTLKRDSGRIVLSENPRIRVTEGLATLDSRPPDHPVTVKITSKGIFSGKATIVGERCQYQNPDADGAKGRTESKYPDAKRRQILKEELHGHQ